MDRRRRGRLHSLAGRQEGGRELRGRWLDMHDKPVSFDARRYYKVEPHEGNKFSAAGEVNLIFVRFRRTNREDMCYEMTGAHFRLCGVNGAKSALSQAAEL